MEDIRPPKGGRQLKWDEHGSERLKTDATFPLSSMYGIFTYSTFTIFYH